MGKIIRTLDQLSYKKILSISIFMAILLAIPVAVYVVSQQTRMNSRAAYVKPEKREAVKATPGPIPNEEPILGRVFPWVGKEGDIVWIQGKHFGNNPSRKKLVIGGVEVKDNMIDSWEDELIQVYIPKGAKQGGAVEISIGDYSTVKSLPYVLFDSSTKIKLIKEGNLISVKNGEKVLKVQVWTGDDEIETESHSQEVRVNELGEGEVFNTNGLPILSIVLSDANGKVLPYYVDPIEFGF